MGTHKKASQNRIFNTPLQSVGLPMKLNPVPRRNLWDCFTETNLLLPHFHLGQVIIEINLSSTHFRPMNYRD
jgi:hypothetical protein